MVAPGRGVVRRERSQGKGLLAERLEGVQGALDVADLLRQRVDGLHGAVQLLTTCHQRVHSLETQRRAGGKVSGAARKPTSDRAPRRRNITFMLMSTASPRLSTESL